MQCTINQTPSCKNQLLLLVGLAAVSPRYLERPHALSAWSVLPIDIPKPPEMPSMSQNAAEEDLEQQLDERQVAAKDPLAGLLQMQVWGLQECFLFPFLAVFLEHSTRVEC